MKLWEYIVLPRSERNRRCVSAGTHYPVIIDGGRKLCMRCCTW